jgi:hypothetical protein
MYPAWQAIYLSFFSKELYRQVVTNWRGLAFQYMVLLVLVSWLIVATGLFLAVDGAMRGPLGEIISKLPAITIKDGTMTIDKPSPYVVEIKVKDQTLPVAVFDATTDEPKADSQAAFLFGKHNFFLGSGGQASQFEWKQYEGTNLNQASYKSFVEVVKTYLPIFAFAFGVPFGFIVMAIQSFIWAVLGLAVAGMANIKLTYSELVRLAVVAMTPGMIIEPVIKLVVPGFFIPVGLLITIGYFIFAILANKSTNNSAAMTRAV